MNKILSGFLVHMLVRLINTQKFLLLIQSLHVMRADAVPFPYSEPTKAAPITFNQKQQPVK